MTEYPLGPITGDEIFRIEQGGFVGDATPAQVGQILAKNGAAVFSAKQFGAVGDGVTDDTAAFATLNDIGGDVWVSAPATAYVLSEPIDLANVAPNLSPSTAWGNLTDHGKLTWGYSSFRDEGFVPIWRFPGRAFFGAASLHSGNRFGANGYGADPISQNIASYLIKNAASGAIHDSPVGRIGFVGGSWIQPGQAGNSAIGLAGIARHDGVSGSARGIYGEVIVAASGLAAAVTAGEFQTGNHTGVAPVVSAYDMAGSIANGLQIAVEAQHLYTTGNGDTVYPDATAPAGAAVDIAGGSAGLAGQKWTAGVVFRNGALVRDGNSFAPAIMMAQKHKALWEVSAGVEGAAIWSEITNGASRMALAFANNEARILGPTGQVIAVARHDSAGAGTVNNPVLRSARTGVPVALLAEGSDANTQWDIQTKGTGVIRFQSHGGSGENLRITPPASAPTDYMTVQGSAGLGLATLGSAGASTNIDVAITPKGLGVLRFGSHTANADAAITGYITIKDSGGTVRKLAVIS